MIKMTKKTESSLAVLFFLNSWAALGAGEAPLPPNIPPYQIPTFEGGAPDFKAPVPSMVPAPKVNADGIFKMIVSCYPKRTLWQLEHKDGARQAKGKDITTFDESKLARHYVGIVTRMPLYSASELDREREREYHRRTETAKQIAQLLQSLADRQRAQRELGLYSSLEARSQLRVAKGVAETPEQVGYLEKVVKAQSNLEEANAKILSARLTLAGQCREGVAEQVNAYLMGITR